MSDTTPQPIPAGYETSEGQVGRWVQTDNGPVWVPLRPSPPNGSGPREGLTTDALAQQLASRPLHLVQENAA